MRAFQDEGHTGVLIVGDYTTRIGDPSGRSTERPVISRRGDRPHGRSASSSRRTRSSIRERTEVRFNGEWLSQAVDFAEVVRPRAHDHRRAHPRARRLREAFRRRSEPISVSELLYPLMQAYDSVAVEADVELGGTDQLYNLLAGRDVMEAYGLEPQVVLTTPLLVSWDGDEDERLARELHRARRGVRGAVRQDDAPPGRAPARRTTGSSWIARATRRPAIRWRRSSRSRASSSRARTARRRRRRRRPTSRASCARARRPRTSPRQRCLTATHVHLPALLVEFLGIGSTSEARRLIAQGGVKHRRRGRRGARRSAQLARRRARPGREAPIRAVSRRLTPIRRLLHILGPPDRGLCGTVPATRHWSALRTHTDTTQCPSFRGPLARVGGFFTPPAAPVFENSTACDLRRDLAEALREPRRREAQQPRRAPVGDVRL